MCLPWECTFIYKHKLACACTMYEEKTKHLTSIPPIWTSSFNFNLTWFRPHLHKKGIDDPQIPFMTFWKIINRSSIGIRSDHPDPSLDIVTAEFFGSPCDVPLTCLFVQDSASVLFANVLFLESFSCICNVPLTFFLLVQAGPVFLFFKLFRGLLFFLIPKNRISFLIFNYSTWY